jgi:hypothetical protein
MRAVQRPKEFPMPEAAFVKLVGCSERVWRKYKAAGRVQTIELFGRQYVTPEEQNRIIREGTKLEAAE